MSLWIAVPCALASAVAYGASTAVEHSAAHEVGRAEGGLTGLLRNPRWLLGMAGDTVGLGLQIAALATGPVVLVQPILVLALPVSLPIAWALGGPRPGWRQYRACLAIVLALAVFFALVGDPGPADQVAGRYALITALVVGFAGLVAIGVASRGKGPVTAAVYGGVAGAWFGLVAVMMDATSTAWQRHGIGVFRHPAGFIPLAIVVVLGAISIALTQLAFQVGTLGASFPANLAADPVVAVILGAALLHENVPVSVPHVIAYVLCLAAVIAGAVVLAAEPAPATPAPGPAS
jgi:drug/metabolite transporter (DMT)-like permease